MSNLGRYVGLPWLEHGRTRDGVDCWGPVVLAYREILGIDLPLFDTISPDDPAAKAATVAAELPEWRLVGTPRPLDVALLAQGGRPVHVGLYSGPRGILHIEQGGTSWIEALDKVLQRYRLCGLYRHRAAA